MKKIYQTNKGTKLVRFWWNLMKRAVILTKCINKFMIYGVGNKLIARYRGGENQVVREPHLFKHCYVIYRILHANQKTMLCAKSCTQKLISKHIFNSLFSLVILLSSNNQFRYILVWCYLFAIFLNTVSLSLWTIL